jgi:glutamine synthetase
VFDGDAILRGKYMSKAKFFSALENGFGSATWCFGWDSHDQLFDNVKYTGWHTAIPGCPGARHPLDLPRPADGRRRDAAVPRRVHRQGRGDLPARHAPPGDRPRGKDGLRRLFSALEFEFFMFDETPESIRQKNYKGPDSR